ncbi:nucleoid-associated protein [Catenovulum maritimum]|uniref:Nucleoid-associated protein NdpA n=1 Tax=Catenovulum maritimum TaxID=1513271 RepID=A0A0J8H1R7_9ALTE|nr:nucleoid-associated protein [Catenovulum maritimum]KMT66973.1 hypothetical protein XM47_02455 [Catenovulum maritimum]
MSVSTATLYFNRYQIKDDEVVLQLDNCCAVGGDNAIFLAESLHQSFTKKGQKQYCAFADDSKVASAIKESGEVGQLAELISNEIKQFITLETMPAETILVVAHYRYLATEYLLCGMLGVKESVQLSESVIPTRAHHLDITNIQLAVEIDLTEIGLNPDSDRSIAYIKGRVGRKVGDFMSEALQIEEKFDAKAATQKLVENVESFIESHNDNPDNVKIMRDVSLEVMKSAADSGEFMQIKALSDELEEKAGIAGFYEHAAKEEDFSEECPIYISASKPLQKFFGQGGGMSLSFDRELLGEHIEFNPETQQLIFNKIPPNLLNSLNKALKP